MPWTARGAQFACRYVTEGQVRRIHNNLNNQLIECLSSMLVPAGKSKPMSSKDAPTTPIASHGPQRMRRGNYIYKWMGTADQINLSYSAAGRPRRGYDRTRRVRAVRKETTVINSAPLEAREPEELPVN